MATVNEVGEAGIVLRDGLQARIDDGNYSVSDRYAFETSHFVFSRRLSEFSMSPAHGPESQVYDTALADIGNANTALGSCRPGDRPSIDRANTSAGTASASLAKVTTYSAIASTWRFTSALAVKRPAAASSSGSSISIPSSGVNTPEPTEPYLTSLAKLFPAESLSALLLVLAIDKKFADVRYALIGLIVVASVVLRYFATRNTATGKPDIFAIAISVISFLIYATAMLAFGELFNTDEPTTRIIATVVAVMWMGILTAVVRKTSAP